jgi:hypothetical protein
MANDEVKNEGFEAGQEPPVNEAGQETTGADEAPSLPPLDVYSFLRVSITQFNSMAWVMLGLQPDPFTNEVRKDLVQARVAIDTVAALVELLKPQLQPQEAKVYQTLLTDLRLNFVSHSGEPEKA